MTTAQTAILTITAILLIAWGAYTAYRYITRTHRQLRMLLEAIESADTSLRFPANSDSEVNATLNRIAQSLSALRIRISETEKYYESITGAVATGVIVITPTGPVSFSHLPAPRTRPELLIRLSLGTKKTGPISPRTQSCVSNYARMLDLSSASSS